MKKYWKILPAAALILLYGGSILHRPLWLGAELHAAAVATYMGRNANQLPFWADGPERILAYWGKIAGYSDFALRIPAALATLGIAWAIYLAFRKQSAFTAIVAAPIFGTVPLVFLAGASVGSVPVFVLAGFVAALAIRQWVPQRRWHAPLDALIFIGLAGVGKPAFSPADLSLLIAGMLPYLLFLPVLFTGWKRRTPNDPCLAFALPGPVFLLFALVQSAHFMFWAVAAMPFLAVGMARLSQLYFEGEPAGTRFNRQLRTVSVMLGVMVGAFLLIHALPASIKIDPSLKLFSKRESWLLTGLTLLIPLLWWQLAIRETESRIKMGALALGTAFGLLACAAMLPPKIQMRHAPESLLQKYALPRAKADTRWVADRKLLPAVYRVTGRTDLQESAEPAAQGHTLEIRTGFPKIPAGGKRTGVNTFYFKPADLSIMEYRNQ